MRLKARERVLNSSSCAPTGTRAERSPPRTRSAAATSQLIGRAMREAKLNPIHTAPVSSNTPTPKNSIENAI